MPLSQPTPTPDANAIRDCIVVHVARGDFETSTVEFLTDFAAPDCPVFRPERERAMALDSDTALDFAEAYNARHDSVVSCHVERVSGGQRVVRFRMARMVDHIDLGALVMETVTDKDDFTADELRACIAALRRSPGLRAIALERARQMDVEGYDAAHDAAHGSLPLLLGAIAYGQTAMGNPGFHGLGWWPWSPAQFKPTTTARDAAKSGAMTAAALDVMLAPLTSAGEG